MQTDRGACLKHSKTKFKSFTRRRQAPDDPGFIYLYSPKVASIALLTSCRLYSNFCQPPLI